MANTKERGKAMRDYVKALQKCKDLGLRFEYNPDKEELEICDPDEDFVVDVDMDL